MTRILSSLAAYWRPLLVSSLLLTVSAGGGLLFVSAQSRSVDAAGDQPQASPDLRFETADGEPLSLSEFRGTAVLLNIWATWCAPCRKEMPALDRLQAKMGGADFQVVALSVDRSGLDAIRSFFGEIGIKNLRIYVDQESGTMSALGVVGLPTTVLIDSDGREVQRWVGPAEWDSPEIIAVIEQALQEPRAAGVDVIRPGGNMATTVRTVRVLKRPRHSRVNKVQLNG